MDWSVIYGFIPFYVSALLALALAIGYKAMHKRRQRRSPLAGRQVGKLPGQELVERISDHESDLMVAVMLMYFALPMAFAAWAGKRIDWHAWRWGALDWWFLLLGVLVFAYGLHRYIRHFRLREDARDGLLAERVTGMQLNRLVARGCIVMHDLPADGFNIDHVVISPRGVYAVETKSRRKPKRVNAGHTHRVSFDGNALHFPDFVEKKAVEQANNYGQWLGKFLRGALGREIPVIPALALPGWLIEQSDVTWRSSSVKVFSPMGEGANFMAKEIDKVDPNTRTLVKELLAVRYPSIEG